VCALALVGVLLAPVGGTYLPVIDLPVPSLSPALSPALTAQLMNRQRELGSNRVMDASGQLPDAVRDSDAGVRGAAAWAPGVVRHAIKALGRIRDPGAVAGLVGALEHTDLDVVEEAAQALGRGAALSTAEPEATQIIVHALGRIGAERAVEALIAATDGASPGVRKAVIEALRGRRWGNRVAAPVVRPRPDPNPAVAPEPN